jgi:hypothetical protein
MLLARLLSVVVLLVCVSLTLSQPDMPEMPSGPPGADAEEFSLLSFASELDLNDFDAMGGQLGFGIPYGGGGKAAFPVGAYGANVGLPAVPAVPLAISGGGKGKGGGGHGHKGRGGARLGFLIAAPIPVAQPYGGQRAAARAAAAAA